MSADNWARCPNCRKEQEKLQEDKIKQAVLLYGKVPAETYLRLLKEAEEVFPEHETTLREDYEIGTDWDGNFSVVYCCRCTRCNFGHSCKYNQKVPLTNKYVSSMGGET